MAETKNPQHAGLLLKASVTLLKDLCETSAHKQNCTQMARAAVQTPQNPQSPTVRCSLYATAQSERPHFRRVVSTRSLVTM